MTSDPTFQQSNEQRQRSQDLSRQPSAAPLVVPGYEIQRFLGSGAYGEVWVASQAGTGRQVAIKFYTHHGELDWANLSREVEKLSFLSNDRYVVQVLAVGRDANPPYYVMEYVENGSLDDYLQRHGPMSVRESAEMFREIATGLSHAHGKGILHCDLKPANILLDQDNRPRLADFGQARLSTEQKPALGTLFYMAPEQADLNASPDVRWDVYALGALLHTLLTGQPPHRTEAVATQIESELDLPGQLARYRELLKTAPRLEEARRIPGIDRPLLEVLERCLAPDPQDRYPNVQSVLEALDRRGARRRRRPLVILGLIGPLLFLLAMSIFAWRSQQRAVQMADQMVVRLAKESNGFAADFVAEAVARRIESYFREVEQAASDSGLQEELMAILEDPELADLLSGFAGAHADQDRALRDYFRRHPTRKALQQRMEQQLANPSRREIASWFVTDARGVHVASAFDTPLEESSIGGDFSYRPYFHGRLTDEDPASDEHIRRTYLSPLFKSTVTDTWKIAVSTPIVRDNEFLGVVALTVELGRLGDVLDRQADSQRFNVLIDGREGPNRGVILQHPLFSEIIRRRGTLPAEFNTDPALRVPLERIANEAVYRDPVGQHGLGIAYREPWIASASKVFLEPDISGANQIMVPAIDTGLVVLMQESYAMAEAPVHQLGSSLFRQGLLALSLLVLLVMVLWLFVARALAEAFRPRGGGPARMARGSSGAPNSRDARDDTRPLPAHASSQPTTRISSRDPSVSHPVASKEGPPGAA